MKAILDIETGEVTLSALTDAESQELENQKQEILRKAQAQAQAAAETAAAKTALLARLGITEEEAKLLLS